VNGRSLRAQDDVVVGLVVGYAPAEVEAVSLCTDDGVVVDGDVIPPCDKGIVVLCRIFPCVNYQVVVDFVRELGVADLDAPAPAADDHVVVNVAVRACPSLERCVFQVGLTTRTFQHIPEHIVVYFATFNNAGNFHALTVRVFNKIMVHLNTFRYILAWIAIIAAIPDIEGRVRRIVDITVMNVYVSHHKVRVGLILYPHAIGNLYVIDFDMVGFFNDRRRLCKVESVFNPRCSCPS